MTYVLVDPNQLKRIRSELGITQAKLASEAGVSQSLVAKIESGRVDPTFGSMKSISEALRSRRSTQGKRAAEVMSSPVISVQTNAKLSDCVAVMKKHGISQIPVLAGERPVGSVTETHILELLAEANNTSQLLARPVSRFMKPALPIVNEETQIEALFSLFNYVPAVLVSSADKVEGVITKIDLLAAEAGRVSQTRAPS